MKPLTGKQRDEFLDKAAIAVYAAMIGGGKRGVFVENHEVAYSHAQAILAERDRRTEKK